MDSKDEIIKDVDLPEVKARLLKSPEEVRAHRWELMKSIVVFAAVYSSIHKLGVPFVLKFTNLSTSPYAKLDYFFIPALALALILILKDSLKLWGSVLCGLLIGSGIFELFEIFQDYYLGWLAISHFVSSVPIALASVFVLTFKEKESRLAAAWIAALSTLGLCFVVAQTKPEDKKILTTTKSEISGKNESMKALNPRACGAQRLELSKGFKEAMKNNELRIQDCGLKPAIFALTEGQRRVQLINETDRAVNLHLYKGWNILVPPHSKIQSPLFVSALVEKNEVLVIYSDSSLAQGLTAIVTTSGSPLKSSWKIHRNPLLVERLEEGISP